MPELPEVESARTLCETHCVGATVTAVAFLEDGTFDEKIFAEPPRRRSGARCWAEPWRRRSAWENTCGGRWRRRRLHVRLPFPALPLRHDRRLLRPRRGRHEVQILRGGHDELAPRFAKLVVDFDNGVSLAYTDPRRFGRVRLVTGDVTASPPISELGFDPLLAMPDESAFAATYAAKRRSQSSRAPRPKDRRGGGQLDRGRSALPRQDTPGGFRANALRRAAPGSSPRDGTRGGDGVSRRRRRRALSERLALPPAMGKSRRKDRREGHLVHHRRRAHDGVRAGVQKKGKGARGVRSKRG